VVLLARRASLIVALALLLLPMALAHPAAAAAAKAAPTVPARQSAARSVAPGSGHAVLVGIPGLLWSDITAANTPTLWRLARTGAIGNLSVRTVTSTTCPTDGWLSVSAGQRATLNTRAHNTCGLPASPSHDGDGHGAQVSDFARLRALNLATSYQARLGLLGDAVHKAGRHTLAIGPGGALAAADGKGNVDHYAPNPTTVPKSAWADSGLIVVDADNIARTYVDAGVNLGGEQAAVSAAGRADAVHAADQQVAATLARVPSGSTIVVAGVSSESADTRLRAGIVVGPRYHPTYLTSASTHRPGLATLTDITPTLLSGMGAPSPGDAMVGKAWQDGGGRPATTADAVTDLVGADSAALVSAAVLAPFFVVLVAVQILLYIGAAFALRRRFAGRPRRRRRVLGATRVVALAGAAGPVASYLANIVPWWRAAHPLPIVIGCMVAADVLVVALALGGRWRRGVMAPVTIVAGITALTLGLDVLTGSHLQLNSPTGYSFLVGGRYYGFGNMAFAVFATSVLLAAAGVAHHVARTWGRRAAVAVVVAAGLAAVVLDGWPSWGADVGGVIAIVPGAAVAALMIAGRRVSLVRLGVFCAVGVAVITAIAVVDYLRPAADRTHLGVFVQQVIDGDAGPVLLRKLSAMLHSLSNVWVTALAICALLFLFLVLRRPTQYRASALDMAYSRAPALRAGLTSAMITAVVGCLVNDSGIQIPALALTVAIPLALAASVRALELGPVRPRAAPAPEPRPVVVTRDDSG
jgi:hypothetical protein